MRGFFRPALASVRIHVALGAEVVLLCAVGSPPVRGRNARPVPLRIAAHGYVRAALP